MVIIRAPCSFRVSRQVYHGHRRARPLKVQVVDRLEALAQMGLHRGTDFIPTEGPTWGHPMLVLGAICSFLEPFCGHLSPKLDKVS